MLNPFSRNLSTDTGHKLRLKLMHNYVFNNITDLKSDLDKIQKGELLLMVKFWTNKIYIACMLKTPFQCH